MSTILQESELVRELSVFGVDHVADIVSFATQNDTRFVIPVDAGRKVALSRLITHLVDIEDCYLVIHEYGVWPSSELMDLFRRVRLSEGIDLPLPESRCEKYGVDDIEYLQCVVFCCLSFSWSFSIAMTDPFVSFYFDDDEWMSFYAADPSLLSAWMNHFQDFRLEAIRD